jgi:hypothetical protein
MSLPKTAHPRRSRLSLLLSVVLALALLGAPACESEGGGTPPDTGAADVPAGAPDTTEPPADAPAGADVPFVPTTFVEDCLAMALPADLNDGRVLVWNGPGVRAALVRDIDPDSFGTSGTTVFRARRLALERDGLAVCQHDEQLSYEGSHHNFADVVVFAADARRLELHLDRADYDSPWVDTLLAIDPADGATLWGPLPLTLESCTPLTTGSQCQAGRRGEDEPK